MAVMRLTIVHAHYWARQRAPAWARQLLTTPGTNTAIHACINAHAGPRVQFMDAANTVQLLKLARRTGYRTADGTLGGYLRMLADPHGWSVQHVPRRARLAAKWLRRLEGERG